MGTLTLAGFMSSAFGKGCEASIVELALLFEIPLTEHPFEISLAVQERVSQFGLIMVPGLPKGSHESPRLICSPEKLTSEADMRAELELGEGPTAEFKSTFMFDVQRSSSGSYSSPEDLKSDAVVCSALKTIAAFLNSSGGVLYVGVDDLGNPVGIQRDFQFLAKDKRNVDGWELEFRQQVQSRFLDGVTINSFVRITFVDCGGNSVARIEVPPRKRCTYFRKARSSPHEVFVRQGNRSVSLTMPEFEDFLVSRTT